MQKASGMKEGVRRTKFIPRVGNWENQAKRQSAALYADTTASAFPRRNTAKVGRPLLSPRTGGELVEEERLPPSPGIPAETAADQEQAPHEALKVWNSAANASSGVAARQLFQERHAGTSATLTAVERPWTGRTTEASAKLAAAVHSVINETAQLETDFANCVVDFESLVSEQSNFIHQIDEKLAALGVDESAAEAAAVSDAPEQAESSRSAVTADFSPAGAVSERREPALAHVKQLQKPAAPTRMQGQGVRPPFSVKKVPSKWSTVSRRKLDRSGG